MAVFYQILYHTISRSRNFGAKSTECYDIPAKIKIQICAKKKKKNKEQQFSNSLKNLKTNFETFTVSSVTLKCFQDIRKRDIFSF
jgi:hypothetical protein